MREGSEHSEQAKSGRVLSGVLALLSCGYWKIIAVVGVIACLSWPMMGQEVNVYSGGHVEKWENGSPKQGDHSNSDEQGQWDHYSDVPANPEHPVFITKQNEDKAAPKHAKKPCDDRTKNESRCRSLDAQISMAKSAKNMVWPSWSQVVLSLAGFCALFFTLILTAKTAKSAEKTVAVMRETSEIQNRAYVLTDQVNLTRVYDESGDKFQLIVEFDFKNTGHTPAFDVICRSILSICTEDEIESKITTKEPNSTSPLGPGQNASSETRMNKNYDIQDIKQIKLDKQLILIKGAIIYTDINKRDWRHDFCWIFNDWEPVIKSRTKNFGMTVYKTDNGLVEITQTEN